jgi:D-alanyl-D-alanine carboxypeptidase
MSKRAKRKKILPLLVLLLIAAILGAYFHYHHKSTPAAIAATTANTSAHTQKVAPTITNGFNENQYSINDPTSIWVVVNKLRPLNPINYAPTDLVVPSVPLRGPGNETMQLRQVVATALEQMFAASKTQGINLMLASGYRSYSYQTTLYNSYVQSQGQAAADLGSARSGHSEHQTGLAADLEPVSRNCELEQCFATTPEGEWLAANCYKYGFIIRYTLANQPITGYEDEPWHVRYIGTSLAGEMHSTGVTTLEQFFGLPAAPNYAS